VHKIVLVNPPLNTEERYGVHFKSGGMTPPLGLAYLAAILVRNGDCVRIVDGALSGDYQRVADDILRTCPKYVGITASTISIYNAAKLATIIKQRNHLVTVIIGGPHITATSVETMRRFPAFDVGVIGEADYTLIELLDALEKGSNLSLVNGIVYRWGDNIGHTAPQRYTDNLDALPPPAWELLPDLAKYYCPPAHTVKQLPAALLVTSRGCPNQCTFCDRSVFGNKIRANSATYVLGMIQNLYHVHGIREFQFRDDNFLAFRPRLVELCRLLKLSGLGVTWSIAGRADMVNPEILELLADAGCWQIWYGIESGSQRVLDFVDKRLKLDKIKDAVTMTKKAGIDVGGFFMIGIPTETRNDIEATIKFSRKLKLDEAHFTFLTPLPGCEMYETVKQYGRFNEDWRKANMWNPVFVPTGITEKQLIKYWKRASVGFYLRPRIIFNYIRKVRSIKHVRVYLLGLLSLLEAVFFKKYTNGRAE